MRLRAPKVPIGWEVGSKIRSIWDRGAGCGSAAEDQVVQLLLYNVCECLCSVQVARLLMPECMYANEGVAGERPLWRRCG